MSLKGNSRILRKKPTGLFHGNGTTLPSAPNKRTAHTGPTNGEGSREETDDKGDTIDIGPSPKHYANLLERPEMTSRPHFTTPTTTFKHYIHIINLQIRTGHKYPPRHPWARPQAMYLHLPALISIGGG